MLKEWITKQKIKGKLLKVFHAAEIYDSYKSGKQTMYIYPTIVSIRVLDNRLECVFILPTGFKTNSVTENEVVFKQVFGKHAKIETDNIKKCVLNVYANGIPNKVKYDFNSYVEKISGMKIPIVCGIDVNGQLITFDLAEFAHILLSGETGSGKSSLLHTILTTIIQYSDSEDVHLYLGDMKRSEFGVYRGVKHVKGVFTDPKDLIRALKGLKKEADRRGDLQDKAGVNHVNDLPDKLPIILFCIDEVFRLKNHQEAMKIIDEISSIGRSLSIHLILSLQRPDSNVFDKLGNLKNNLRVAISGHQSDRHNAKVARVVGADKIPLDTPGRMMMNIGKIIEFQAPFIHQNKGKVNVKKILSDYKVNEWENSFLVTNDRCEEEQQEENEIILGVLDDEIEQEG